MTDIVGRLNGMGASREAALMAKLEAAENEVAHIKEVEFPRKVRAVAVGWETKCARLEQECDAMRAKIEAMEKQEPFDADSDVFRSAFEAALKAGNWPATRQGDGYRAAYTHIAWRIAFSTVNRLKLYLAPGTQPTPSIPEVDALRAASNNDREITPLERRCYLMGETHLSGYRLIIGFESLEDCNNAHDFLIRHYPKLKTPEAKP